MTIHAYYATVFEKFKMKHKCLLLLCKPDQGLSEQEVKPTSQAGSRNALTGL